MAGDVLAALLGVLAGGARGYEQTTSRMRAESAQAEEAEKERQIRRELLGIEVGVRREEGKENRKLRKEELLQERELSQLRLQAEKDALTQELNFKRSQALTSSAIERAKLDAEIDANMARLTQINRELNLKSTEVDIDRAYKLGTGKLGTGTPAAGRGGKGAEDKSGEALQGFIGDVIKNYMSAIAESGDIPDPKATADFVTRLSSDPFIGTAYGLGKPKVDAIGGERSGVVNPNLSAVADTITTPTYKTEEQRMQENLMNIFNPPDKLKPTLRTYKQPKKALK